ncbi:hypothetical protein [Actinoplanes teichomyceticus]|uniref:hypothetical protein n=1 Tax=Actinoplanes teichomyceticus TaxID=1867 RepID=UPI000F0A3CD8|nr:hypothetical protein [Actinoplanes teichomyceticus]GIF14987.1 hypothetical protein Ate01nite_50190 [Actinoplanes teichomyceticus]
MTNPNLDSTRIAALPAARVVCADSVCRALLATAVPPQQRRDSVLRRVPVLGRRGELPPDLRRAVLAVDAADEAVPLARMDDVDVDAVAAWIAGRFPAATYPAAVLGSPHGAAVHLAAACRGAWLPTSFTLTAPWPGGSAGDWVSAMAWGTRLAQRLMDRNPAITVRQVHDPVLRGALCGATVSLQVRWRTLPPAYRDFLERRIAAGGSSVLVRDLRTWPVLDGPPGYGFQIGTPTSGWTAAGYRTDHPAFRRLLHEIAAGRWPGPGPAVGPGYAETSGEPTIDAELHRAAAATGRAHHRVYYTDPQALSAGVADMYRAWWRSAGGGRHALVHTARMTDPWRSIRGRMVPYWCESSSRAVVDAVQLWLAGSEPFDRISVLPDPPGSPDDSVATLTHWRAVAAFAARDGRVDELVAGRYPLLPPAAAHATRYPVDVTEPAGPPAPLPVAEALRHLGACNGLSGLVIASA